MRFTIEAGLMQGEPRLRVFDADSGALRLQWRYRPSLAHAESERMQCEHGHACAARANLQALMRELFLLSCTANASLQTLDDATDACARCDFCTSGMPAAPLAAGLPRHWQK